MKKCPTDCPIIQDAMKLDEKDIEAFIEYNRENNGICKDCEYNKED